MVTYFVLYTTWKTRTLSDSVMFPRRRAQGLRPAAGLFLTSTTLSLRDAVKEGTAGAAADSAVNLPP